MSPLALRRFAGALFIAGPVVYLLAEFVTAAAWTDPPYSYTYHYISNLGVHGPADLLGQRMYSPLAVVMNTGFFLFGITILAGVVLAARRWALLVPAVMLAVGGVLLGLHPGTGNVDDGSVDYHSLGAMAAFVGGNVLAIVLGRMHGRVGISARLGRTLVGLGVLGLVSMVGYFIDVSSEGPVLIGLVERGVVYPFIFGFIAVGAAIAKRRPVTAEPDDAGAGGPVAVRSGGGG